MAEFGLYDASKCYVYVNKTAITGLAESMISWEKEEGFFNTSVGAKGDVVKSVINNSIHTLTITVQSTSPSLPYLMKLAKSGVDAFPVEVNYKGSPSMKFGGSMANINEMPSISLGNEAEDIEITFTVFDGYTTVE